MVVMHAGLDVASENAPVWSGLERDGHVVALEETTVSGEIAAGSGEHSGIHKVIGKSPRVLPAYAPKPGDGCAALPR